MAPKADGWLVISSAPLYRPGRATPRDLLPSGLYQIGRWGAGSRGYARDLEFADNCHLHPLGGDSSKGHDGRYRVLCLSTLPLIPTVLCVKLLAPNTSRWYAYSSAIQIIVGIL